MHWMSRLSFKFLPEMQDVIIDRVWILVVTEYFLEELFSRDDALRVLDEKS